MLLAVLLVSILDAFLLVLHANLHWFLNRLVLLALLLLLHTYLLVLLALLHRLETDVLILLTLVRILHTLLLDLALLLVLPGRGHGNGYRKHGQKGNQ